MDKASRPWSCLSQLPDRRGAAGGAREKKKRGKRARIRARLKAKPSRPALPAIFLSNIRFLDNKLDYLRLLQAVKCIPYYLSREFTAIVIMAVYIPPSTNAKKALSCKSLIPKVFHCRQGF